MLSAAIRRFAAWLIALPLLAGAVMPLQAGINGQLAKHLSSVMAAALVVGLLPAFGVDLLGSAQPTVMETNRA